MKEFLAVFLLLLATTSAHHDVHLIHADKICANVNAEHNILLPSPLDCRIFYKCDNGTAIPQSCPVGLHWCQALTECLLPAIANCTIGHVPVTYPPGKEPTLPPLPTHDVTCLEEGATYPDPSNCANYYICQGQKPVRRHCSAKKVFSVLIGSCVEAEVAVCINDLKPHELCPVNGIRFVDPFDCSSYYECVNNSIETKECAPDMQYNQWFHFCASDELAHCQTYPTPGPTTVPSTTVKEPVSGQNLCPGNGFTLPNYQDCHSFWHCTGDTFVQDYCPPEFYYSCWDQKCLPSSSAQCEPEPGESCSADGKKLPNAQDCHSYYVCKNNEVELEECANGYEFNAWFSECVQPDRAHCSVVTTTSTVSTSSASTPPPSITNDICPDDGVKLPDLNDCHSYYVCVTETPQRRQCPLNTIYSCWDQTCLPSDAGVCITNPNQVGQPCSTDNSTLPDVEDCSTYYVCENGLVQEKHCGSGLEYNKWYGKCVTPNLAHCQHPTTVHHTTGSTEITESKTTGPTEVTTGETSELTDTTTVLSVTNSSVSETTQRPCIKNPTPPRPHPLCPGSDTLIYPEFTHCNQYMECDCNRQLRTYTCVPSGFHYNCESKKCENITHCCAPAAPGPNPTGPTEGPSSPEHSSPGPNPTGPTEGPSSPEPSSPEPNPTGPTEGSSSPEPSSPGSNPTGPTEGPSSPEPSSPGPNPTGPTKGPSSPEHSSPGPNPTGPTEGPSSPEPSSPGPNPTGPTEGPSSPEHSSPGPNPTGPTEGPSSPEPSSPGSNPTGPTEGPSSPEPSSPGPNPTGPTEGPSSPEHSSPGPNPTGPTEGPSSPEPSSPGPNPTGPTEGPSSPEHSSPGPNPTGPTEGPSSPEPSSPGSNPTGPTEGPSSPEHSSPGPNPTGPTEGPSSPEPSSPGPNPTGPTEGPSSPEHSSPGPNPTGPTEGPSSPEPSSPGSNPTGPTEGPSSPEHSSLGPNPTGPTEGPSSPEPSSPEPNPTGPTEGPSSPEHSSPGSNPTGPTEGPSSPEHSSPGPNPTGPTEGPSSPEHSSPGPNPTGPTEGPSSPEHSSPGPTPTGPTEGPSSPEHSSPGPNPTGPTEGPSSPEPSSPGPNPTGPTEGPSSPEPSSPGPNPTGPTEGPSSPEPSSPGPNPTGPTEGPSSPEHSSPGPNPTGPTEGPSSPEPSSPGPNPTGPTEGPSSSEPSSPGPNPTGPTEGPSSPEHSSSGPNPTGPTEGPSSPEHSSPGPNPTGPTEGPSSPEHSSPGPNPTGPTEGPSSPEHSSPGPNPTEPTEGPSSPEPSSTTPVPCTPDHAKPANPLCSGNSSNFKYPAFVDCNAYQICDCNKQLQQVTCDPPEFNYNCEAKKCENITHCCAPRHTTPTTLSTTVSTISSSTSTSTPELPTTCPLGINGAKLPNPLDCKTYFTCDNEEIVVRPCPAGEMYSCWNQRCESPQDSSCINNPNIEGQNCSKAGQLLPNVANCRGYYECVNGQVQAKLCASGQMYDSWFAICVKFNASICRTFPTVTIPPITGSTLPPNPDPDYNTCPFEGALFPNLQDCNSYYECIGGVPVPQNCLGGYVYSCWDQMCTSANNGTCVNQPAQNGDKCSINGVRVSVGDCTSYYECENGIIVLHKCPDGQQFNAAYLKCYPSKLAHCQGNTPLPTTLHPPTMITPDPNSDVCPIEGALLPNPLNCSTYYRCKNGIPTLERCVTGFEYSCWNQRCEPASTAKCISDNPNQSNLTCKYNGQKTQNPEDCHTYYQCVNKVVVLKHCLLNMSYNKWFGICLPAILAHCKATTVPVPVTTSARPTPPISSVNDVCPINGGLLPYPTDCTKYYECVDNKPIVRSCPSGQEYSCWDLKCKASGTAECINSGDQTGRHCALNDQSIQNIENCANYYQCNNGIVEQRFCFPGYQYNKWYHKCVQRRFSHCTEVQITSTPTPTPIPTTGTPSTEYDLCPVDGARLPDLVDCTKYYICHNNTLDVQSCPDGQSYSCWDQKCEENGVANCINYGVSQVGANCSIEGLRLSDVQNCSSYYECINGTVTQEDCQTGLQFNFKYQNCYTPDRAHCQVTPTITPAPPATSKTTVTPNPVNDVCPNEGAMLPNPLNCSTFYKCINGNPILQECANGLQYSCWDQRCESPDQANCISQPTTPTCSKNGQRNVDPTDCHKYLECVNGTIQSKTCIFDWYYNKWFEFCVPLIGSAHCGQKVTVTPKHPTTVTTVQPITDTCPTNGERIPDPKDCSQYYECVKGKPTIKKCPDGKKYSYPDEECKKESEAKCINVGSPIGQSCKHEGLRVQNLQSCTSYYECINGVIEQQSCLPLYHYNRWFHSCKLVVLSHCQTYPTIAPPTTVAPAVTTKRYPALSCSGHRQVASEKDCNKYAMCENSVVLYNCHPGTNYDAMSQTCVPSASAKCAADIEKYKGKSCSKDGVTVADPKSCYSYYQCTKGKIMKAYCGLFRQYDIWSGTCGVILLSQCSLNI